MVAYYFNCDIGGGHSPKLRKWVTRFTLSTTQKVDGKWIFATFEEAKAACEAEAKRLVTPLIEAMNGPVTYRAHSGRVLKLV